MPRRDWWSLSDSELLAECDEDRLRAGGPGGQKRNKTDSTIRLRHRPTGLVVMATESRSQSENRARALRRLRESLAYRRREPLEESIAEGKLAALASSGEFELRPRDPRFLPAAAEALDLLQAHRGRIADAAERLGISTATLSRFFASTPDLWQSAQQIRQSHGLPPLRS